MDNNEEHELKMAFARRLQSAAATVQPGRRPRIKGRADTSLGYESVPLGVHPAQVQQFRDLTKAHGLSGITYSNDGACIVTSEKHKRKLMQLRGFADRNGMNGG
jgi:hypothetical protein